MNTIPDSPKCLHLNFGAAVDVSRIPSCSDESVRYQADVKIACADCGIPMRFIGLPFGVDLNGAAVSVDGTEGRFSIAPKGEVISAIEGLGGFTIKRSIYEVSE